MKMNELMASEMIAKGEKLAYLKPSCSIFSVEPESPQIRN